MTDIYTAFEIGMSIGGLACFGIFAGGGILIRRIRPKSLTQIMRNLYFEMPNDGDQRTIKITVQRVKKRLKLIKWVVVSDLY